jgi:hypothetical protein
MNPLAYCRHEFAAVRNLWRVVSSLVVGHTNNLPNETSVTHVTCRSHRPSRPVARRWEPTRPPR